jgi:hypothetical protein
MALRTAKGARIALATGSAYSGVVAIWSAEGRRTAAPAPSTAGRANPATTANISTASTEPVDSTCHPRRTSFIWRPPRGPAPPSHTYVD